MESILREKSTLMDKAKVFFNYSIPVKIIISSLLTALSGTTYFAVISNYSIYYYSMVNGFRLPSEGSPFIIIAISAITFIVLFTAGVLFASLYGFARLINTNFQKLQSFYKRKNDWAKKKGHRWLVSCTDSLLASGKKTVTLSFILTCSFIAIFVAVLLLIFLPGGPVPWRLYLTFPTFMGLYPILIGLPFIENKFRIIICAALVLIYIILSPMLIMDEAIQSKLLAMIKYGGDTKVALHFDQDKTQEYNLVFRSSQSLFVRTGTDKQVSEFPLTEVKSIDYLRTN